MNAPAIALYEAYGFTFTGATTPHPSQPGLVERGMSAPLTGERYSRGGAIRYTS